LSIINNCSSVRYYAWRLRSAILLALEMMNEWTPTFFLKYFYAGIVQSNLCWKIHNKYVFHVNIHIFVQKQIIQNQFKISEGGKWSSHQMPCDRHPVTLFTRDADWHKLVTDLFYDFVSILLVWVAKFKMSSNWKISVT
jgi:hypothetical protein